MPPPPRRSSPSKTEVAAEGPPHLPQPGEHVPTSAARGQPPAATLDFRGDRPEGRAERGPLLPRKVARVPQQGGASLPSLQLPLSLLWPSGVSLGPSQLRDRGRPRHLERREGRRSVPLPGPGGGSAIRRAAEAWEPPRRDARRPVELPHREALGDRLWGGRTSVTPRIPDRSSRGIPLRTRESVPHATVVHLQRSVEATRSHKGPNARVAEIPHREALGDRLWGGKTSVTPRILDRSSRSIPLRTRESVPHASMVHLRRSVEATRSHERSNPKVSRWLFSGRTQGLKG